MTNEELRRDNDSLNCTVLSDNEDKRGRPHYWIWEGPESNTRICTTCGRCEEIPIRRSIGND